jgi:hypothetical protein
MSNRYLAALIVIIAGLLYIAIPHSLLPVCEYAPRTAQEHAVAPAEHTGAHGSMPEHGHPAAAPAGQEPPAEQEGTSHMVCFWTAKAELGLGALVVFGGLLLALGESVERRLGVTLMLAACAVFGAAIPAALIGVCPAKAMPCRAGTLPALLLLSGFLLLFALLNCRHLLKCRK